MPKGMAQGQLPGQDTPGCSCQISQPQIPPADSKAQLQPGPEAAQQKQSVPQMDMLPAQGPEKIIPCSQPGPIQNTPKQPLSCLRRRCHRNRRLSQPPEGVS